MLTCIIHKLRRQGTLAVRRPWSIFYFEHMWCDQAKSVWSRSNSVFIFLINCMHHFYSFILQKTPLKLVNWFQRYEQLKHAKNNKKQKTFFALFGSILKSIFPTSDWFCLITSHIVMLSRVTISRDQFNKMLFGELQNVLPKSE